MAVTLNASTSTGYIQTADTSGDLALQSNGTTQFTVSSTGAYGQIKAGTAVTASGTSVDFTGIPSWVKRVTVMFSGVSTNGTSPFLIQLGDSGGVENTSYNCIIYDGISSGAQNVANSSVGWQLNFPQSAAASIHGQLILSQLSSNTWVGNGSASETARFESFAGAKTLSGTLDRVRVTTVNGTDTFDAGTINILYEG